MKQKIVTKLCKYTLLCILMTMNQCKNNTTPDSARYPSWFLKKPQDSEKIYGLGEGVSYKDAQHNALNDIATQLCSVVSSNTASQTTANNSGYIHQATHQNIAIDVPSVTFSNHKIVETFQLSGRFMTLVSIDKRQFLEENRQNIERIIEQMLAMYASHNDKNALARYEAMLKIIKLGAQARKYIQLIGSLEDTTTTKNNLATIEHFNDKLSKILDNVTIAIQCSDQQVRTAFSSMLQSHKIKSSTATMAHGPKVLTLHLEPVYLEKTIQGVYWVRLSIQTQIRDRHNIAIYSNDVAASGRSILSYAEARRSAIMSLKHELSDLGLARSLGIDSK